MDDFTAQYVFNGGQFRQIDYFDLTVSAALKSTPLSETLKASIDLSPVNQRTVFNGSKGFSEFAIESSIGIGLSVSPLNGASIGSEFGLSSRTLSSPISQFGQFSYQATEGILSQSATKYFKNEF